MFDSIRKSKPKSKKIKVFGNNDTPVKSDVRKKLDLQSKISDDKVKYILGRLAGGNPRTWKALGITSKDFDQYGIKGYNK